MENKKNQCSENSDHWFQCSDFSKFILVNLIDNFSKNLDDHQSNDTNARSKMVIKWYRKRNIANTINPIFASSSTSYGLHTSASTSDLCFHQLSPTLMNHLVSALDQRYRAFHTTRCSRQQGMRITLSSPIFVELPRHSLSTPQYISCSPLSSWDTYKAGEE